MYEQKMAAETRVLLPQWEKRDAKPQKSSNTAVNTEASLRPMCDEFHFNMKWS